MFINKEFTVTRDDQKFTISSHVPGNIEIRIIISDLLIDCTYSSFDSTICNYEEQGWSLWNNPLHHTLWDRMKDRKFPGFIIKICNKFGKILHWERFIINKDYKKTIENYYTDILDVNGSSYADFFYTDLCDNMDFSGTVIDAGANTGFFTLLAINKGAKKVYSIEPDPYPYYYIEKNFLDNPLVIPINKAMSHDTSPIEFSISNQGSVSNSQFLISSDARNVSVEAIDIASILRVEKKIDLLKLDIEGTEYKVLENLSDDAFSRIESFFIEFHNFSSGLCTKLLEKGYSVEYRNSKEDDKVGFIYAKR